MMNHDFRFPPPTCSWSYVHYGIGSKIIDFKFPEGYPASIPRQLESVSAWLKDKFFLLGDNVSYVDFILYEVLDVAKLINPGERDSTEI